MPDLLTPPTGAAHHEVSGEPGRRAAHRRVRKAAGPALVVAALGIVFGDIGTSPLYAMQTVFELDNGIVQTNHADVLGVTSMMLWALALVVSLKYVMVVLRADNDGEGGVLALAALVQRTLGSGKRAGKAVMTLGLLGAALFYGDSLITPAISVLSAVEGVKVVQPSLGAVVLPIAIGVLLVLFASQRFGTQKVGAAFGPVMVLWFALLAVTGLHQVLLVPEIVKALSPMYAASFCLIHPVTAFVAMGAIVLCITGAEALYADMGHFGRKPIMTAWFAVAFPALAANYLGQGALLLANPAAASNPFFLLLPHALVLPVVLLATVATVIASQAVISGAFSVSRQAIQLGVLPAMTVRQTSEHEGGQVYLPAINAALFVGVVSLTLGFGESAKLATAYGVAVTATLMITTVLLCVYARVAWRWPLWKVVAFGAPVGGLESTFFAANLTKVAHGGWLPLVIAGIVFTIMTTWQRGRAVATANRLGKEGTLAEFIEEVHRRDVPRVPGTAIFPHPSKDTTPLALRSNLDHNGVLHERIVILSAQACNVPHIPAQDRIIIDDLGYSDDGILHLTARYGFSDRPDLPAALVQALAAGTLETDLDVDGASWFISRAVLRRSGGGLGPLRSRLFLLLARNAADPAAYFNMPLERTVVMGSHLNV